MIENVIIHHKKRDGVNVEINIIQYRNMTCLNLLLMYKPVVFKEQHDSII